MTANIIIGKTYLTHGDRTKVGIGRARARGTTWGAHGKVLAARHKADAEAFAEALRPLLAQIAVEVGTLGRRGSVSATAIARELNSRGILTPKGGKWYPTSVRRLIDRLGDAFSDGLRAAVGRKTVNELSKVLPANDPGWKHVQS